MLWRVNNKYVMGPSRAPTKAPHSSLIVCDDNVAVNVVLSGVKVALEFSDVSTEDQDTIDADPERIGGLRRSEWVKQGV